MLAYAASRIRSKLKGRTYKFRWLQTPATKNSFLSITSPNPATIRICSFVIGDLSDLHCSSEFEADEEPPMRRHLFIARHGWAQQGLDPGDGSLRLYSRML